LEETIAKRTVRQIKKDEDGDIIALCDNAELWSPRYKQDAIIDIENSTHTYYVPWIGGSTEIRVVNGTKGKYLRTDKDNSDRNNLEELPDC
jgi:hypothetical protein